MQIELDPSLRGLAGVQEAKAILGNCVHCGFCTATCPTYQLLGNELDGPRGRIYLIKSVLESGECSERTRIHLDRCLTCRSCETTCPSGVRYGRLLEVGRDLVDRAAPRSRGERLVRWAIRKFLCGGLFAPVLAMGRLIRPILPSRLAVRIPQGRAAGVRPATSHDRRMLVLEGCVQPAIGPNVNAAAARILDRGGISLVSSPTAGCCGALSLHMSAADEARQAMRRNIDAWWPLLESGVDTIAMTASGCGVTVREYGELLADDPEYAEKAGRVSAVTRDLSEILNEFHPGKIEGAESLRVAFHSPCTLQHGQQITGIVERVMERAGFSLVEVSERHMCCGAAGTYSILQPEISSTLLDNRLAALNQAKPDVIATGNIGCQVHLQTRSGVPVVHWVELLDNPAIAAKAYP
mgnify:FL=1